MKIRGRETQAVTKLWRLEKWKTGCYKSLKIKGRYMEDWALHPQYLVIKNCADKIQDITLKLAHKFISGLQKDIRI